MTEKLGRQYEVASWSSICDGKPKKSAGALWLSCYDVLTPKLFLTSDLSSDEDFVGCYFCCNMYWKKEIT